jgi:hypothetical protein
LQLVIRRVTLKLTAPVRVGSFAVATGDVISPARMQVGPGLVIVTSTVTVPERSLAESTDALNPPLGLRPTAATTTISAEKSTAGNAGVGKWFEFIWDQSDCQVA